MGKGRSVWVEPGTRLQWERDVGVSDSDSELSLKVGTEWRLANGGRMDFGLGHQFGGLTEGTEFSFNLEVAF
ncbi:hypothetical protein [Roseovarius nanhaiticus]|uniref:hypothetical protein n=1 Tax=Roseovarius nanhaiticus TaxID=573024 RepID=UPI00249389A1|nr:hypothetical protein [Roseovarius nanhaiticus]